MRKTIITGANGFVGSHLVRELIDNKIQVISIIRNANSDLSLLPKSKYNRIVYCDMSEIKNLTELISDRDIDVFYHMAWQGSAGNERSSESIQMQNVLWTSESVKVAKELGCKRFVGAGSIIEKETISLLFTNDTKLALNYIYGAGKLMAHILSKAVATQINIEHVWGMITNAYGPGEISPRLINTTLRKIIKNEELQFTSATQNYDFIYITDVARAFYYLGCQGKPFNNYVIGSNFPKPLKNFLSDIAKMYSYQDKLNFGAIPSNNAHLSLKDYDSSNLYNDTEFQTKCTFEEGIRNTMNWLQKSEINNG